MLPIVIRSERPDDVARVADVVRRAYADVSYSDRREHLMVERLRRTTGFIPDLSLLAMIDATCVGHILLTRARVVSREAAVDTLALAPLSVTPSCQRSGVGRSLIAEAHARAADLGFETIILVGDPGYYRRFGYQPLGGTKVELPFAPPERNRLILPLVPGSLDKLAGVVDYAPGWLDHEPTGGAPCSARPVV